MSISDCCLKGFQWDGSPVGKVESFPGILSKQAYVTGSKSDVAIMLIHDMLGFEFNNTRLLADHYAKEADATVYMPDFFNEKMPIEIILDESRWKDELDLEGFHQRFARSVKEPEVLAAAEHLRSKYKKVGAVGYCFGGWAVFWLGARERRHLLDCIVAGHPTFLTKEDVENCGVPAQILAPEIDPVYPPELKEYTWKTLQENKVPFDYQHFPGVQHSCFTRGDSLDEANRDAQVRGKNSAVFWFKQYLHGPK